MNRLTLCSSSGLVGAEPAGLGWAEGVGSKALWDGQGSSDREDSRSWTVVSVICCWGGGGSGRGEGLGSEDKSRAVLPSLEEHRVLLSLWASGAELPVEQDALSEVELTQVPLPLSFRGTSTEKRSEETLGWWMSTAAVVTRHVAGSGTPLSAREGGPVTCHPQPHLGVLVKVGPSRTSSWTGW